VIEAARRAYGENVNEVLSRHPALAFALSDDRLSNGPGTADQEGRKSVDDYDSFRGHPFSYAKSWLSRNAVSADAMSAEILINGYFGLLVPVLLIPIVAAATGDGSHWWVPPVVAVLAVYVARLLASGGQDEQTAEHALVFRDFLHLNWFGEADLFTHEDADAGPRMRHNR
jgi:hypothetical protein